MVKSLHLYRIRRSTDTRQFQSWVQIHFKVLPEGNLETYTEKVLKKIEEGSRINNEEGLTNSGMDLLTENGIDHQIICENQEKFGISYVHTNPGDCDRNVTASYAVNAILQRLLELMINSSFESVIAQPDNLLSAIGSFVDIQNCRVIIVNGQVYRSL